MNARWNYGPFYPIDVILTFYLPRGTYEKFISTDFFL